MDHVQATAGILGAVLVALIARTAVPSADAPQQPAATSDGARRIARSRVSQSVLHHLPQPADEGCRSCARHPGHRARGTRRRDLGEGRQEDPHRHDAAERRAPSRADGARSVCLRARVASRSGRRCQRRTRDAGAASTESDRVRQRDSRSAGARRQREHAAARRRIERGVRQPRRGAGRVTVADSGLRVSGDEDQPPRRRRSHAGAVADDVRAAVRAGAGPPYRRAPARHTRRRALSPHVPARRRVRVLHGRARRRARRRSHARRRAGQGRQPAQLPSEGPGGAAHPRTRGRRSPARRGRGRDLLGLPRQRRLHHARRRPDAGRHRPVQRDRCRRHAEPAGDLQLQTGEPVGR